VIPQHQRLVTALAAAGRLPDAWRPAFEQVPRHLFVPVIAWLLDHRRTRIDRDTDAPGWLEAAYADEPIIIQWDDGAPDTGMVQATSSLSMPTVVALMLDALDARPGHRVLEIGTGSGWNAALLSHRLGVDNVTSVEVDPAVAAAARTALGDARYRPHLVVGDGTDGYPANAPYDRVIATCSVTTIPQAWIRQTRPGGVIVAPWNIPLLNGLLLRLVVGDDGTATGFFVDTAVFMAMRSQRPATDDIAIDPAAPTESTTIDPRHPLNDDHAQFAVGLVVGSCYTWTEAADGGYRQRIDDPTTGSWTTVDVPDDGDGTFPVRQGGPRRLWDEIAAAFRWWQDAGSPVFTRFGIHVTADTQYVFLDQPTTPIPGAL
jgi:protein-L-isoaspartate(D-aspartate) O-methyltransferase